jgi:hypothetical protein
MGQVGGCRTFVNSPNLAAILTREGTRRPRFNAHFRMQGCVVCASTKVRVISLQPASMPYDLCLCTLKRDTGMISDDTGHEPPHILSTCVFESKPATTKVLCGSPSTNLDRVQCRSSHEIIRIYGSKQECFLKPVSLPRFVPK